MQRWVASIFRWTPVLVAIGGGFAVWQQPRLSAASPGDAQERAAIAKYCLACHNQSTRTAGLALDKLGDSSPQHAAQWEKVIKRLRARSMPPAGLPRPDDRTYEALAGSLGARMDAISAANPNPGRSDAFRRLTRFEYQNVIRDLLALDVDVSPLLPSDDSMHGFDNTTIGDLSPALLERYLSAAQKISRLATGATVPAPGGYTVTLRPDLTQEGPFDNLPLGTRGGVAFRHTFPQDAEYEINVRLARDRNEHVEGLTEPHDVELMLDGERLGLYTVKPPAPGDDHHAADQNLKARVKVKAGPHVVAAAFPRKPWTLLETERQPYPAHFNMDRHPRIQPAVYSVSVNGPYDATGPGDSPSRRRLFVCTPAKQDREDPCARKILATLMRRAYRRPVEASDLVGPLKFYEEGGMELALRAVLMSPEFLFRVEEDPAGLAPGTPYRLSDLDLASRLSFFLWSSIPDDELLHHAITGDLHVRPVLGQQVRRMLADSRSDALVNNFAGQWLYLRNLESITPDMRLFPDFDDNLRQSFRRETELFFQSIVREDRNVLDLLRANYTFVNERLAKHYGIPNVYGSRFRRVTFGDDRMRGGLLRQGSILTVTSYATRTSPVLRGKWVLANILGTPPPPAPPNVPSLKENAGIEKGLSMRDRLAQHRVNPACSGCHQLMDPPGFALENFDAVGRWRTREGGAPIDVAGGLPDGSKFEGVAGLEKALLTRPDVFATTFTEKLLTYATGRGVEYFDAAAVREIVRRSRMRDYRFSSFIQGIVTSTPFQMRRAQ